MAYLPLPDLFVVVLLSLTLTLSLLVIDEPGATSADVAVRLERAVVIFCELRKQTKILLLLPRDLTDPLMFAFKSSVLTQNPSFLIQNSSFLIQNSSSSMQIATELLLQADSIELLQLGALPVG